RHALRVPTRAGALHRGEGIHRHRRGVPDRGRGEPGGTHRRPDPDHVVADHARAHRTRRPRQPRGGRPRRVRRETGRCGIARTRGGQWRWQGGRVTMTEASAAGQAPTGFDFESVELAVQDIAAGKAVVVVDDEDRETEGDLMFAAEKATPELLAFMVRYTSGYVCVSLTGEDCERLDLPPMFHTNQDVRGTAYTVTVDAAEG